VNGLLAKSFRDQRRALLGWGVAVAGAALMYASFYPSIKKSTAQLSKYLENLPQALRTVIGSDFTSPAGYLRTELFSILGPIMFLVFAIGAGGRAIAGEEEARTLDLLLSAPVRRRRVLADKFIAMVSITAALAAVIWATVAIFGPLFTLTVPVGKVAAGCLMLFLLGTTFGAIALAAGSATGHRGLADAVAGGLALITYIVNVLAPQVDALKPLQPLCPFRWYLQPDPLNTGVHAANVAVLVGITAAAFAIALVTFERRDLAA
jgi:ABC-2 type transport system permease protein